MSDYIDFDGMSFSISRWPQCSSQRASPSFVPRSTSWSLHPAGFLTNKACTANSGCMSNGTDPVTSVLFCSKQGCHSLLYSEYHQKGHPNIPLAISRSEFGPSSILCKLWLQGIIAGHQSCGQHRDFNFRLSSTFSSTIKLVSLARKPWRPLSRFWKPRKRVAANILTSSYSRSSQGLIVSPSQIKPSDGRNHRAVTSLASNLSSEHLRTMCH